MKLDILNLEGSKTGEKIDLPSSIFSIQPNTHAIYLDVKRFLASNRQGTHKSKERGEVIGSTKKIKKQKGTGTARAGSIKNPLFRGGGTVFGPKPRSYKIKLNKKVVKLARKSSLFLKYKHDSLMILDQLSMKKPSTNSFLKISNNIVGQNKKVLYIIHENDMNIYLSARNIKQVDVVMLDSLNTYQIVNSDFVVFTKDALSNLESFLS